MSILWQLKQNFRCLKVFRNFFQWNFQNHNQNLWKYRHSKLTMKRKKRLNHQQQQDDGDATYTIACRTYHCILNILKRHNVLVNDKANSTPGFLCSKYLDRLVLISTKINNLLLKFWIFLFMVYAHMNKKRYTIFFTVWHFTYFFNTSRYGFRTYQEVPTQW